MMLSKPNFVFIYPDSLGANAIGCYGNATAKTPAIDALAQDGVRFSRCISQNPVCMPSRACLHTGKYVTGHGVRHNGCGTLSLEHPSFAQMLAAQGYHLAYYGKTHSVNQEQWDDVFDLYPDYNRYLQARNIDVAYPEHPPVSDLCAGVSKIPAEDFPENVLGRLGESFIYKQVNQDKPFFLFMSHEAPHSPWVVPQENEDIYSLDDINLLKIPEDAYEDRDPDVLRFIRQRQKMATDDNLRLAIKTYYTLSNIVDRNAARLVQALNDTGLRENTIVVVMADHGDHLGNHRSMGKSLSVDQSLIHVPLIVNALGRYAPRVVDDLVESIDFYPTLMELAGITDSPAMHGRSLRPYLTGNHIEGRKYTHSEEHNDFYHGCMCAQDERYKLVVWDGGHEDLYDLQNDPYEWHNLARNSDLALVKERLKNEMIQWRFRCVDRKTACDSDWVTRFLAQDTPLY